MNIQDYYNEAKKHHHHSLELVIKYLVFEKKALKMTDSADKLTYFLQERFRNKMNDYLTEYEENEKMRKK